MNFGERYQMASCYGARYSRALTELKRQLCGKLFLFPVDIFLER
jgi:hypothetical protein